MAIANLRPKLQRLGRNFGQSLVAALRPANLDRDRTTLDPAEFTQSPH
jgi:hypothetical protein